LTVAYADVREQVHLYIQDIRKIGTGEVASDTIMMWWIKGLGRKVKNISLRERRNRLLHKIL
jgi:hypothetical protein